MKLSMEGSLVQAASIHECEDLLGASEATFLPVCQEADRLAGCVSSQSQQQLLLHRSLRLSSCLNPPPLVGRKDSTAVLTRKQCPLCETPPLTLTCLGARCEYFVWR